MKRLGLGLLIAAALGALAIATVDLDTDARALTGVEAPVASALDTPEGRALVVAIIDPDRGMRSALARELARELSAHPMVARASAGAIAPPAGLADWLWRARFVLAPPPAAAFTPEAIADELGRARASLTGMGSGGLAHYLLLDPSGSFRRLIEALSAAASGGLTLHDGVPQARDDSAAILTLELAPLPFDAEAQHAFDLALSARIEAAGARALTMGPRSIAARISTGVERQSLMVAGIGAGLLLLWLGILLRSPGGVTLVLVPLAIGLGSAVLLVQAVFGTVHVVALGFGGALLGLSMDYPLHLLAHGDAACARARTRRLVLLGAATTAIAFLSLVGAGLPAIAQVGLFVAAGLAAAALAAIALGPPAASAAMPRIGRPGRWTTPWKLPALALIGAGSLGVLALVPGPGARSFFALPPDVSATIGQLDRMIGLPSGRYHIEVEGQTLEALLAQHRLLAGRLDEARARGWLGRAETLADMLPAGTPGPLPSPEALADALAGALPRTGLRDSFAAEILAAYRDALGRPPIAGAGIGPLEDLLARSGLVRIEAGTLRSGVRLWDVREPARLADALADLPAARFIDREAALADGFARLTARVLSWFAIGIAGCAAVLVLVLGRARPAVEIMASCLSAAAGTAALVALAGGGLGVFELMALALVVGIGIDYGIFLTLSESRGDDEAATRSVVLCAATTLIAFVTMAIFGSGVLRDIGMTVSIGVIATGLAAHVRQRWPQRPGS